MIRPTPTGYLFMAICALLYLAAVTSQSGFLLLLIGVFAGCAAFNAFLARRSVLDLQVDCPKSLQVEAGATAAEPWTLTNLGGHHAGMLRIESQGRTLLQAPDLPSLQKISLAPAMCFPKRGVYPYQQMRVVSRYPFGLMESRRPLDLKGEIVVYPRMFSTPPPDAHGFDVMVGGKFRGRRKTASGSNFAGVRPFEHGDAFKQIHWKSSSKGLGLMVKVFDEELSGRVGFIVDSGSSGDPGALDALAAAAGSLVFAAQDAGHHVEWHDLSLEEHLLIPPFADGAEVLYSLARMNPDPSCLHPDRLERAVERINRKAAVCFMLTQWNEAVESMASRLCGLHRKVSLYLPESAGPSPQVDGARSFRFSEEAIRRIG